MHIVVHIIFTVLVFGVVLHGQGAGGGDRGHHGSSGSGRDRGHHGSSGSGRDRDHHGSSGGGSHGGSFDHGSHGGSFGHGSHDGKFGGGNRHGYSDYPNENGYNNRDRQRPKPTGGHHSSLANVFYVIIFVFIAIIASCCICGCCILYICKSKSTSNTTFASVPNKEPTSEQPPTAFTSIPIEKTAVNNENIFQSGVWSGRYFQYEAWHDPQQLWLSFDSNSFTINGHGSDDVGRYTVTGKYSTTTNEIELIKAYQQGTGDEEENLGHSVTIEVTWDSNKQLFSGNWYVDTNSYRDENIFELKFEKSL
ncbi:unnamed protein product [Rotaria socialis]|uniref:Uncharacterized protein n=1 Tax=Rotaria socialis TaxID=392032 RepID=A0A820TMC1_9BILA|nr:unnamed protein product [Rotaria socialis]CAF4467911.1 unnamed protein product [Rotaria socialis]